MNSNHRSLVSEATVLTSVPQPLPSFFKRPIPASFCLFSPFSHHKSNINWKSIDAVLGDRTRGRKMVGADGSTELVGLPVSFLCLLQRIKHYIIRSWCISTHGRHSERSFVSGVFLPRFRSPGTNMYLLERSSNFCITVPRFLRCIKSSWNGQWLWLSW